MILKGLILKSLLLTIVIISLLGSSLALAQTESTEVELLTQVTDLSATEQAIDVQTPEQATWFSVSSSLHYIVPSLDLHIGVTDALSEGTGLRATLSTFFIDSGGFVAIGLNSYTPLNDPTTGTKNYVGFGPRILSIFSESYAADAYEPTSYSETFFAIGGFWGTEFNAQSQIRPYTEFNTSLPLFSTLGVFDAFIPVFSVTGGFNVYF